MLNRFKSFGDSLFDERLNGRDDLVLLFYLGYYLLLEISNCFRQCVEFGVECFNGFKDGLLIGTWVQTLRHS